MNKLTKPLFPETATSKTFVTFNRVKKFRRSNSRIDYYPSVAAKAVLDQVRMLNPNAAVQRIIDLLILKAVDRGGTKGNQ